VSQFRFGQSAAARASELPARGARRARRADPQRLDEAA